MRMRLTSRFVSTKRYPLNGQGLSFRRRQCIHSSAKLTALLLPISEIIHLRRNFELLVYHYSLLSNWNLLARFLSVFIALSHSIFSFWFAHVFYTRRMPLLLFCA
jgi:hypothetical protein